MFTKRSALTLALAVFYLFGIAHAASSCSVALTQTLSTTWTSNDGTFSLVQVAIKNSGSSAVTSITLNSGSELVSFWEMDSVAKGQIVLPDWRVSTGIEVGDAHTWGYIVKARKAATITVTSTECNEGSATAAPSTQAPVSTQAPSTKAPTPAPTPKATSAPSKAPTTKPGTAAPTTKPSTSGSTTTPTNGGRICPDGQIWSPASGTTWQWQLTGTIDQSFDVQMYDIDLFDATAATITQLHQKGRVVICYFSTQYEDWRPDASKFTSAVLGANLDDWVGERFVDIRSTLIRQIMSERLDLAKSKGCDGVEPDNVDGYANKNGLGLTAADQLAYNKYLAQQAHSRGLSIGLKNDLDQVSGLVSYFDWALNEQCNQYGECGSLAPFVTAGKAVFGVEYSGSISSYCPKMATAKFSWLAKKLDLGAPMTECCASTGGCQPAAYKCVAPNTRRSEYAEEFIPDAELQAIEAALAPNPFEEAEQVVAQEAVAEVFADVEIVA